MYHQVFQLQEIKQTGLLTGPFYVMETFPAPYLVLNEEGNVREFDNWQDAFSEAKECQHGYVISLG